MSYPHPYQQITCFVGNSMKNGKYRDWTCGYFCGDSSQIPVDKVDNFWKTVISSLFVVDIPGDKVDNSF